MSGSELDVDVGAFEVVGLEEGHAAEAAEGGEEPVREDFDGVVVCGSGVVEVGAGEGDALFGLDEVGLELCEGWGGGEGGVVFGEADDLRGDAREVGALLTVRGGGELVAEGVEVLVGGRTNLSGEGTLIQATNLGTTTSVTVPNVGTFTGDTGTDGLAGIASIASTGGGSLNAADIGSAIDPLFFTETWTSGGTGMRVTITLPDAGDFLVEFLHGESRNCCTGRFSTATFSDVSGSVPVPEFTIGNGIASQNPPADADWVIIRAAVQGVSTFTYTVPNGTGRGTSIMGFQIRRTTFNPTDSSPFIREFSAAGNTTYKDDNGDDDEGNEHDG